MQITFDNTTITYQLQYSKRKTFDLSVTPEGLITVKAPLKSTSEDLEAFLAKYSRPLMRLQNQLDNRQYVSSKKAYTTDENYLYLGKACKLNELLPVVPESEEEIRTELELFYTRQTRKIIKARLVYYEGILGVKAKSFIVGNTPGTWGTCNSKKELTFNYRLSMAKPASIDYVIIHELCHIFHMNHDRSFWRKVGTYDKNYKENQEYLNRFGGVMTI